MCSGYEQCLAKAAGDYFTMAWKLGSLQQLWSMDWKIRAFNCIKVHLRINTSIFLVKKKKKNQEQTKDTSSNLKRGRTKEAKWGQFRDSSLLWTFLANSSLWMRGNATMFDHFPLAKIALGHRIICKAVFRENSLTFHSNVQDVKQICLQSGISGLEEIWNSNSAFGLNKSKFLEILCDLNVLE